MLTLLRLSMGILYTYAGVSKIANPSWSAAGYLSGAKSLQGFYGWLASPDIVPLISFVNEWALALLGISLLTGLFVRWSTSAGALLMALYYTPILSFPFVGTPPSFLVDQHIIYIFALLTLGAFRAGEVWGLDMLLKRVIKKH